MSGGGDAASSQRKTCYFYVIIPPEDQAVSNDCSGAITSPQELTAILKRNPHARFQSGSSAEEAEKKALERIQLTKDTESIQSPRTERRRGRSSLSLIESSLGAPATPSPKTDELLMMGREILTKQNEKVFDRIEKNPRILCTESEFPTILQEGMKLNAMHLAAKSGNHVIMQHILNKASSIDFMRRIYPTQSEERLKSCSKHLTSCYLNTPDKMSQETPLHFACKFNALECVELILSHPFCDVSLKNFEQMTALEVVGQRDQVNGSKAKAIRKLFSRRYVVPIWRDMSVEGDAPVLGEASFIPDLGQAIPPPLLAYKFPDFSLSLLEPCRMTLLPKPQNSHLKVFASQPPSWKIMAFAGPTDLEKAKEFRKLLKRSRVFLLQGPCATPENSFNYSGNFDMGNCMSPPRTPTRERSPDRNMTPPTNDLLLSPISSPLQRLSMRDSPVRNCSPVRGDMTTRVRDVDKGLERIGYEYARDMNVPWSEYWRFLGRFCDITSEEGLDTLEKYLCFLETRRQEDKENSSEHKHSTMSSVLNDVIDKMTQINLNSSGIPSPDGKTGFCTNPNCRLESRFCNCEDVVPHIPYFDESADMDGWIYGDVATNNAIPFSGGQQPFMGIRRLETSANTDSFELSNASNSRENEFDWPMPEFADVFATAPSSPVDNDVYEDCSAGAPLFFNGYAPGKLDLQLYQILKDFSQNLDRSQHLTVFQWLNSMHAYGNSLDFRARRGLGNRSPDQPSSGPNFASTPVRGRPISRRSSDSSF